MVNFCKNDEITHIVCYPHLSQMRKHINVAIISNRFDDFFSRITNILLIPIVAFVFAFSIYLGVAWFILPPNALWSPDEGAKLWQVRSFRLEEGQAAYDVLYAGRAIDPELKFAISFFEATSTSLVISWSNEARSVVN